MPLQKSFSDTNHSTKPKQRSSWSRNKSYPVGQAEKQPSKPLQEKPAIPVSTTTKNKLSAFQFGNHSKAEGKTKTVVNLVSDDEKENEVVGNKRPRRKRPQQVPEQDPEQESLEKAVVPEPVWSNVPSTPADRLALPDLIGMGDVIRTAQRVSPDERIEWDITKHSGNSPFCGIKKARKRARSSSPVGSSPSMASGFDSVDPGSELWGRYSLNGSNAPTPQGPSVPALAHIMHTSSPQPHKEGATPRSGPSFRRANSCGNQFPKRRKVRGSGGDDVFTESVMIRPSKLSVLIERVQEGLTQPKRLLEPPQPSSSPHLSFKRDSSDADTEDTSQTPQNDQEESPRDRAFEEPDLELKEPEIIVVPPQHDHSNMSDYGDFDDDELDASILEVFSTNPEVAAFKAPKSPVPKVSPKRCLTPRRVPAKAGSFTASLKASTSSGSSTLKAGSNEFDDSDEEMFLVDLENIASQFDEKYSAGMSIPDARNVARGAPPRAKVEIPESDDEFGDDGLDDLDFEAAEATATQSIQESANSLIPLVQKVEAFQRYIVTSVRSSEYVTPKGRKQPEKILILQLDRTNTTKVVHLREDWLETPVTVKAFAHVIGTFDRRGECIVDNNANMIILHPDHLISATVVGDSFGCTRRAVLQDRIKAANDCSAPMLYGTILHEIFQSAMLANRWDTEWLDDIIEQIATRHLEDLYAIKVQISDAAEYLKSKMPELQAWAELFVSSQPNPQAIVKAGNGETASMCVSKLLDVEEHVWSPLYGLKGNIDATVQVTMQDGKQQRMLTVPFEVKTGKNPSPSHRAQTALYNLLLSDRYDVEIAYGILYYMETSETIRIPTIRNELRYFIMQRNQLACFVRERHAQLPPMQKKESMCNRCYAKVPCFIYHKLADDGNGETSGLKTKFDDMVNHLTPKHKEFFLKWEDLITKEEKESLKYRPELWTMLSSEREKLGRCFSNVIIEPGSAYEDKNSPKINRYRYTLIKEALQSDFSFLNSQLTVGEAIVISDENGHFALAKGFVTHVRKNRITVAVDRRLHNARIRQPGFDEVDNQVFASIMEVAPEGSSTAEQVPEEPIKFRLDKDEFSNGMATVRNNLIQVMADGPFMSRQIRGLVVDMNAPRFKLHATAYTLRDRDSINVDQRRAIQKVMSAEDYALVLGMPGTGKTTTIAHIIRALVSQGKSVLLTSYTHTAVDNILLKLKDDSIPILRLGAISKISKDVQEFATLAGTPKDSFEEIRNAWHGTPIVATTCLGINHAIFNERTFDYCIVDEASQITLPTCLGPIRLARTFILVGDHYQLPPLVQNEEARRGGLDISLFKHLSDTHPNSVVYLEHQYRMCEDVMTLSNNLIYSGRLKCGSQAVASRSISIPNMDALRNHHFSPSTLSRSQKSFCTGPNSSKCWIRHLLAPKTKVRFINTDPLLPLSREQAAGNRIINPTEVTLCTQLVDSFLSVGIDASEIGVITHYRSQLASLKTALQAKRFNGVEIDTADRFQGRDKEIIVLSLVRSNEAKHIGELLKDWRRINVAFTRAKSKLLVIGSKATLLGNGGDDGEEMVASFVRLMEKRDWVFDLPVGVLGDHLFEEGGTQGTVGSQLCRPSGSQWRVLEDRKTNVGLGKGDGNAKRKSVFGEVEGKENKGLGSGVGTTGGKRQPNKRVCGQKPFKIPAMSVLRDVVNNVLS